LSLLYFDHNATTPPRPEALRAAESVEREAFGNPSSLHAPGRRARATLEESRERIAELLHVAARELVFTSGGTEANRLAIEGALGGAPEEPRPHAVVSRIEHPSVIEVVEGLAARGSLDVSWVDAGVDGRISPDEFRGALRDATRLVCVQHANNETGSIQPIEAVAAAVRSAWQGRAGPQPLIFCDAVQSLGKTTLEPPRLGADLASISAHKVGGAKGVGALWIRSGVRFATRFGGGPQERKLRPGTENLPGIAAFAAAMDIALEELGRPSETDGVRLGPRLANRILETIPGAVRNGGPDHVLSNTVNVSFPGVPAELLAIRLDAQGAAVSLGSACASGSREPSHVLRSMGLPPDRVSSAIRLSTGWTTSLDAVERLVVLLAATVEEFRRRLPPREAPTSSHPR